MPRRSSSSQWQFLNRGIGSSGMSNWHNEHIMQWYRRRIKAITNSYEVQ
nr:MAG TPA: anticodon nuclease activator family protein [Caudoviricetes sp.]